MPHDRAPRQRRPEDRAFRSYAATIAVFATILYGALLIAVFGFLTVYGVREPIAGSEFFGPMASAVTAAAAIACVFALLLMIALSIPRAQQRVSVLRAVAIGFAAYLAYAAVGPLLVGIVGLAPLSGLIMIASELLSPFALLAGVVALVIAVLYMLVLASRVGERGRPQWPWEKDDDDRDDTGE